MTAHRDIVPAGQERVSAAMNASYVDDFPAEQSDVHVIRARAYEISQGPEAGTPDENWLRAEREFAVQHEYDTLDRDLERLGMTVSRIPLEAGAVWRLSLPQGEQVEAWEPGNDGLVLPPELMRLIGRVVAGKQLVPAPPLSRDPGALRLREMIEAQRLALLAHDPGVRLGEDPENLHEHRVAARRARAFLRASRAYVDPVWRRALGRLLGELGEVTGPVRDLDVLLQHVREELERLEEPDRAGGTTLVARLERERETARQRLLEALDQDGYRLLLARLRLPPRLAQDVDGIPLERIARAEFRRLTKAIERLGKHPSDAALHGLRIRLKRARYAAELSGRKGAAGRRFLADARTLQTLLGDHQDAVVAEAELRAVTVGSAEAASAFVAGRLAERQRARRERATERLPAAWKRLRKSARRLG
jgi:CHAD domain-containing protein